MKKSDSGLNHELFPIFEKNLIFKGTREIKKNIYVVAIPFGSAPYKWVIFCLDSLPCSGSPLSQVMLDVSLSFPRINYNLIGTVCAGLEADAALSTNKCMLGLGNWKEVSQMVNFGHGQSR